MSQTVHEYSATHKVLKMSIRDFLALPVKNWKHNRAPDSVRCKEIAEYICKVKKPIETVFYLAYSDGIYSMVDGIHRYTALQMLAESDIDYITEDGDLSWLLSSHVFLNIRFNATNGDIIDFFQSLNKSNPVPELYMHDTVAHKRETVEMLTNTWSERYVIHLSLSVKPQRPHFNRNRLIDLFERAYDLYEDPNAEIIEQELMRLNAMIALDYTTADKPLAALQKCRMTGMWLFMLSTDELLEKL
jgi:hypothetical protein